LIAPDQPARRDVRIRRQAQRAHNSIAHILIADRFPVVRDGMRHIIDDHRKFAVIAEVED